MTAKLIGLIPESYEFVSDYQKFFDKVERRDIEARELKIERSLEGGKDSCTDNLFFGFFFDGTKNNYKAAQSTNSFSNVARLYDCYPGQSVPDVLPKNTDWSQNPKQYKHFFKVYVPGVSTKFEQVFDYSVGPLEQAGAAAGFMGESRIAWALIQAINNVSRHLTGQPVMPSFASSVLASVIKLDRQNREVARRKNGWDPRTLLLQTVYRTRAEFTALLKLLHSVTAPYWTEPGESPKIKGARKVGKIYISIFGFSRGATQARAFTNWLRALCELDAELCGKKGGLTLGGFDVNFDFLGLFDTVASVGLANTIGNMPVGRMIDGHAGWADAEDSLRIQGGIRCVHLMAANEIRRSFPVDSIAVGKSWRKNGEEIVLPGVHSDVGGGYCPREQGRGVDPNGSDMLSRIPLVYMYRAARLAGVPLKLELASEAVKSKFKVDPKLIKDFNAYISSCTAPGGSLTEIMREQAKNYMLWRRARREGGGAPISATASFGRASNFDKNDLQSANIEFSTELNYFAEFLKSSPKQRSDRAAEPGFDNSHQNEWLEIARWWHTSKEPAEAVKTFFDNYVHDSRAWFKLIPGHPDSEVGTLKQLEKMSRDRQMARLEAQIQLPVMAGVYPVSSRAVDTLTPSQHAVVDEYERTKSIPRMQTSGREPFDSSWASWGLGGKGGYLRYRKIYGGSDEILLSKNTKDSVVVAAG